MTATLDTPPTADSTLRPLFILLHGAGAAPASMQPLAQAIQAAFPAATILIPPCEGLLDAAAFVENLPERVAQTIQALASYVREAQQRLGVLQPATALAGFSQGAMMALALAQAHDGLAGRVLAFSGGYAELPNHAPQYTTLHLLHGAEDPVMKLSDIQQAQRRLTTLQGDVTLDVASRVGHSMHPVLIQRAIERLQTCVPLRSWEVAFGLSACVPEGQTKH